MKPWTVALIIVLIIAVVAGAAYLGTRNARQAPAAAPAPSTIAVGFGQVDQTVTAPGHLAGTRQVTLAAQTGGRLVEVNVRAGQQVHAGAVLAQIDSADLALQLQLAQVNLKVAQDRLAQASDPATAQDIATARARLEAAQAGYDRLTGGPAPADLAAAQAAVAGAQASYDAALKSSDVAGSQLAAAAAALDRATAAVQRAQSAYDRVAQAPGIGMRPESINLQNATIDYQQAKGNYDALALTASSDAHSRIQGARSQLQQAQATLARLQGPPAAADLASAGAQLAQAKNDLEKLLAGPDANALDIAQNGVETAEIAIKQAQLRLDGARVVAPFDGVVLEVRANAGDMLGAGAPLVVLSDPTAVEVVGTIIEEDILLLQIGQPAELFFDAAPDVTVSGRVERIVPQRDTVDNRTAYPIMIALEQLPAGLLPGMTVDASIIIAQRTNVLRLPRALVAAGAGSTAQVQVWAGDHAEPRTVHVGLRGDVYVEIVDGLREGELVVGQ